MRNDLFATYFAQSQKASPALPDGYTAIEYLWSTGTQYIDTGIAGSQRLRFEADIMYLSLSPDQTQGLGNQSGKQCRCATGVVSKCFYAAYGSVNHISAYRLDTMTRYKMVTDSINNYCACNDYRHNETSNFIGASTHLSLFTRSMNITDYPCHNMRLYSAKIDDANGCIRHFLPAVRISDNVAGLYDIVGNSFYTNKGKFAFLTPEDAR